MSLYGEAMIGEAMNGEPIVLVSNFDGFFPTRPNGTFAKKCRRLGSRTIHLADPEDTVVLYEPPSATYTAYLEELYEGHLPCVLAPRQAQNPLDLVDDIARDETLAQRLKTRNGRLIGLIETPVLHGLGEQLGRNAGWIQSHHVRDEDLVGRLNDKGVFQEECRLADIQTPPSTLCVGAKELLKAARRVFDKPVALMLRMARSAGGLGNLDFQNLETFEGWLRVLPEGDLWLTQPTLVEPILPVIRALTSIMRIQKDGEQLVGHGERRIVGSKESAGCIFPGIIDDVLADRLCASALRLGALARKRGYRGWLDVDWGTLEDGSFVGFETNARFAATNVGLTIMDRLRDGKGVFVSHDVIKTTSETTLADLLKRLRQANITWDHTRREGVVVTLEPHGGAFAAVVLGESHEGVAEMNETLVALASEGRG